MKIQLLKIKAEQKIRAQEIRNLKSKRKELKGYVPGLEAEQEIYRSYHIAYCMLRGRTLEQIEPKLRDPNSYHHKRIREYAAKLVNEVLNPTPKKEEVNGTKDLCASGQAPVTQPADSSVWSRLVKLIS